MTPNWKVWLCINIVMSLAMGVSALMKYPRAVWYETNPEDRGRLNVFGFRKKENQQ